MMSTVMLLALSAAPLDPKPVVEQGQPWSVVGARTVGEKRSAFEASVGFPQVSLAYLRGLAPSFDVGGRLSFTYAREGLVSAAIPGLKVQGLVKYQLPVSGPVSIAATFEPGPLFNVTYGVSYWGFALPLGVKVGVAASSALTLGLSFEVPVWVQFSSAPGFFAGWYVPFLPGVGVEYFIKSEVLVFAKARMGPTLKPYGSAEFTLDVNLGVAWRL